MSGLILRYLLCCLGIFVLFVCRVSAGGYYDLTDNEGRSIKAKFLRMHGTLVEIEREDGQKFVVNPATFIEADQQRIAKEAKLNAIMSERMVGIKAVDATTEKVVDSSFKARAVADWLRVENYKGFYTVTISNSNDIELKDLTVEYRYFVFIVKINGAKRKEGDIVRVFGKKEIASLPARASFDFETNRTDMKDSKLLPPNRWGDGGRDTTRDEFRGIWVRVYMEGRIVGEYINPVTLTGKERWQP